MQCPAESQTMSVKKNPRTGKWSYRKRIQLPTGRRTRIKGTPNTNTKAAAESAESAHVFRLCHPGAVASVPDEKEVPTVASFVETFLKGYAADHTPTEQEGKRRILKVNIVPKVGGLRLDQVNQITVDLLRADLLATRSAKTTNNILSVLSSLLGYAAAAGLIEKPRLRFITRAPDPTGIYAVPMADVEQLLAVTGDVRYRAAILLAAESGLRCGELRALRWEDIDQIGKSMVISRAFDIKNRGRAPKHGKVRTGYMTQRVFDAIRWLPQRGETLLTKLSSPAPLSYWAVRDALGDTYDRAGVARPPSIWHCLRHTFGTELADRGVPVHQIKELMGHARIETTLQYMHTNRASLKDALQRTFG